MNPRHIQLLVVRPALQGIGLWSQYAEQLVMGTGAVESRFQYLKQLGDGPALGPFQCEPATHRDIWDHYLSYRVPLAAKVRKVAGSESASTTKPPDEWLTFNLRYAAAICRIHYLRKQEPLPHNLDGMARYWKEHYNTPKGRGTVGAFLDSFKLVEDLWDG